jgi:preprotein translocase subunit Sec63
MTKRQRQEQEPSLSVQLQRLERVLTDVSVSNEMGKLDPKQKSAIHELIGKIIERRKSGRLDGLKCCFYVDALSAVLGDYRRP